MKIRKRYIILGLIFGYIMGKLLIEKFDNRPIKLERYKTERSLETYLNAHYPIGSDGNKLISDLVASGAECSSIDENHKDFENSKRFADVQEGCTVISTCERMIGFVSVNPLMGYKIRIYTNKNNNIVSYFSVVFNLPN